LDRAFFGGFPRLSGLMDDDPRAFVASVSHRGFWRTSDLRTSAWHSFSQTREPHDNVVFSILAAAWMSVTDLRCTPDRLVPRELAELVDGLLRNGPPTSPVQVGIW